MTRILIPLLALSYLCFMAGALLTYQHTFPYGLLNQSYKSYLAMQERATILERMEAQKVHDTGANPVTTHLPGAYDGYTVYSMYGSSIARLVDMDGRVVHTWQLKDSTDVPPENINWFDMHAFPNGDLLVVEEYEGGFPYGFGVRKIDKDSKTIWKTLIRANHAANIADDGRIAIVWHRMTDNKSMNLPDSDENILEDMAGILDENGNVLDTVSLTKLLSDHTDLPFKPKPHQESWDPVHSNSAMLLDSTLAPSFPMFKPGSLLVSIRNGNALAIIDMQKKELTALETGPWRGQHDAQFTPGGTIIMFDNYGMKPMHIRDGEREDGRSRIVSYNPATEESLTLYGDREGEEFFSVQRGRVKILPNKNLLITESDNGRVFEINPERKIVWEFNNPFANTTGVRARIQSAKRYAYDYFQFLGKTP